jgi:hypothetical protein
MLLVDEKDLVEAWELIFDWEETLVILLLEALLYKDLVVGYLNKEPCLDYDVMLEKSLIWVSCLSKTE